MEEVLILRPEEYSDAIVTQTKEQPVSEFTAGDETMRAIEMMSNAFNHARDAFINASRLGVEVRELQATVQAIKFDLERTQRHNSELDLALADVRKQRDEAFGEINEWRSKHAALATNMNTLAVEHEKLLTVHSESQASTERLHRELNDTNVEVELLRQELAKAKALNVKFQAHISEIGQLFAAPVNAQPDNVPTPLVETDQERSDREHWERQQRDEMTGQFGTYPSA